MKKTEERPVSLKETDKKEIRKTIRRMRRNMNEEEWRERSRCVCEKIREMSAYREARVIYVYLAARGEVLLDELIEDAWRSGKCVMVPKVEGNDMFFCRLENWDSVQAGFMGIREPVGQSAGRDTEHAENPEGNVLFLMPGIAFDEKGNRVGQGGGYYDRFLARHPMPLKLGAAFSFQIFPKVPAEAFDVAVDGIVTDEGR